jgi:hypothetical protein
MTELFDQDAPPEFRDVQPNAEIITEHITTADKAYETIVEDAVRRTQEAYDEVAVNPDEATNMALNALHTAPKFSSGKWWMPITFQHEEAPGMAAVTALPDARKKLIGNGWWLTIPAEGIDPALATTARDHAFLGISCAMERIKSPWIAFRTGRFGRDPGFGGRALQRYLQFVDAHGIDVPNGV